MFVTQCLGAGSRVALRYSWRQQHRQEERRRTDAREAALACAGEEAPPESARPFPSQSALMAAAARDGSAAAELRDARTEIAPFIALHVQFRKALITQRDYKRARATAARLLAAAEKAMPADSLVLA